MGLFLIFEASEPRGTTYRFGLGCLLHPKLAALVVALKRLI
jgi:hypothetical protein